MPFEVGHKKSKGRPKGSRNERGEKLRELTAEFLANEYKSVKHVTAKLDRLEQEEGIGARIKAEQFFFNFVVPRLQAVDVTTNNESLNNKESTSAESITLLTNAGIDMTKLKKASNE